MGFTLALRPERVYDRIELMIGAKRKPVGGNVALTRYRNVRTMPAFAGRGGLPSIHQENQQCRRAAIGAAGDQQSRQRSAITQRVYLEVFHRHIVVGGR